ncbi:hypothetical protein Ana3638_18910 [Anaerocolumna sedimenticola]|uniref:Uncharacterized protein n=1 Tax=Anaerocolumna sedimenticola TaxID=2696063 RepID=A0A6P1TQ44_9FIRM|nr:hypothetical protein [Anaerocolumna sedimenticola]QHQ62593.1 hypothetical protein Ana3638_18910 [Anaerocolumna sedimenticola]
MKKNAVIILAVIAISVASVKTGYAFYGKQISNTKTNVTQVTSNTDNVREGVSQTAFLETDNTQNETNETTDQILDSNDPTLAASGQADDSLNSANCCGSGSISMIDENGNLKDRETFEKELKDAVANGDITEDDAEYYSFMYGQCAQAFGAGASDSGNPSTNNNNGNFPSCH